MTTSDCPVDPVTRDVIVIGAGPAGCLCATLLARQGLSVTLVERREIPRRKVCGGCLNAHALTLLARAGLEARVRALGAARIDSLRLCQRGRFATITLPQGLAVSRAVLDESLASAAVEAGVELLTETTALVVPDSGGPPSKDWREVSLQRASGPAAVARGRAIVVADGLGHTSLRGCPPFGARVSASSRIGIGGEAEGGAIDIEPGAITMAVSRHGYAGAVEIEQGRINVAAAIDPAFLRSAGGPAGAVQAIFAEAGVLARAPLDSIDWMGTLPLSQTLVPRAARRIFVIGDAAGYVEPFTGEGMAWAFAGAEAVVPFVKQAIGSPGTAVEREWAAAYANTIGREQRWCRAIARGLRRPAIVSPLVAWLGRYPGFAAPVVAHLSPRPGGMRERTA